VPPDRFVAGPVGPIDAIGRAGRSQRLATGSIERDAAIVAAEAPPPHPRDLAHGPELIEQPRLVARHPCRKDVALQHRRGDREPGQLVHDLGQPFEGGRRAERRRGVTDRCDPVPGGQEATERRGFDRLHLAAEARERTAAKDPQDVGVDPFALGAARPELTAKDRAGLQKPFQRVLDDTEREAPAAGGIRAEERPVRPSEAGEQTLERRCRRAEECVRHAGRWRDPDAVAVPRRILDRDPAVVPSDACRDRPSRSHQLGEPRVAGSRAALAAGRDLSGGQVAKPSQEVMELVGGRRLAVVGQRLEAELEVGERLGVEQLAQLLLAEQLAE
jgi:hypothetical protein